jgi:hypothetical protein
LPAISYLIVLAVLAIGVSVISAPLRAARRDVAEEGRLSEIAELEAARDQKLVEIRDAELDLRTGKLSEQDWGELDSGLRAEAVALLHRLDTAQSEPGADSQSEPDAD